MLRCLLQVSEALTDATPALYVLNGERGWSQFCNAFFLYTDSVCKCLLMESGTGEAIKRYWYCQAPERLRKMWRPQGNVSLNEEER